MRKEAHINVTIDFGNWGLHTYDLRIPAHLPVKQLLMHLMDALKIEHRDGSLCALKVKTKNILLTDDDYLIDYPVADGDVLEVL